jgi:hypothetical protein
MFAPKVFVLLGASPETVATQIVAVVGFIITVYGRLKATQRVTLTGAPPSPDTLQPKGIQG